MAIPVYLQQFKAAGVYRVVFDKSTIAGVDSEVLRLVVGYSEQGPFNIPTYVKSVTEFTAIYGGISKKLEKRGVFFHRTAIQALGAGPILALNLKRFAGETVDGATISTDFNPQFEPIDTVTLNVEDIFDTARFWELSAEKLNTLPKMTQYINICATNTSETSGTYFIRKASGTKVSGYNITVNDWYANEADQMPEYLEDYKNSLISDFFAEIYVFKGEFKRDQVLASSTLKNYFDVDEDGLRLKPYVINAYGDAVDTLDMLYQDETSNAITHHIGCLIPNFKNKKGQYVALDVLFNIDNDTHNMMMSFNTDLLDEDAATIDLSGRHNVNEEMLQALYDDDSSARKTNLLGNLGADIIANTITYESNILDKDQRDPETKLCPGKVPFVANKRNVTGTLYVSNVDKENNEITIKQVNGTEDEEVILIVPNNLIDKVLETLHATEEGKGTRSSGEINLDEDDNILTGIEEVITSISRIEMNDESSTNPVEYNVITNVAATILDPVILSVSNQNIKNAVYPSSLNMLKLTKAWNNISTYEGLPAIINNSNVDDTSIEGLLHVGDCVLGQDKDENGFYTNVYVQRIIDNTDDNGDIVERVIVFTDEPLADGFLVRVDAALNQEIGEMRPQYLRGYDYKNAKPASTSMIDKLNWHNFILSTLTDYKGIRTALLDKANIDYRYVVDTFEGYIETGIKKTLAYLCREKQSAFAILNFPSVKTFVKCPYASFTDANGVFNVQYIVDGCNKKKAAEVKFTLPEDIEGASFCAFYTPLKFSDGYVDFIYPSAGLVSNLFIEKYASRQPYYIIAGPNYGHISAVGLVGPDYTYSQDELQIIEPYGVNCMIYRPGFGTFINANQTAKQTPVSALSKVNVRELVIYIQDEIEKVLQAYQWEFNNPVTRNAIKDKADAICARVAANGGIQAYLNVMDESNNTPEIIDNEMAILSTHIEPGMGCGKMVQELTIYRTGQLAANIVES